MAAKSAFNKVDEVEGEFRRLRKSVLDEYESELERAGEELVAQAKSHKLKQRETRRVLAESGIDVNKLDSLEEVQEEQLNELLQRVRPRFVDRAPAFDVSLRDRTVRSTFYSHLGWSQASLLGADLLASDLNALANVEGEVGNPGVWFYDASQVKDLQAIAKGSGWGCWAYGHVPYANKVFWWYGWIPPVTGTYRIWGSIDYHGFYILYADDCWYNCKNAEVHAYTDVDVHQYFWRGRREARVIDKGDGNISESSVLSGTKSWSFYEELGGGDAVWLKVSFAIDVDARGGGSYAELNFANGKANYLDAPIMFLSQV